MLLTEETIKLHILNQLKHITLNEEEDVNYSLYGFKKIGQKLVDKDNNKISLSQYHMSVAIKLLQSLKNCKNCLDCFKCENCENCTVSSGCKNCKNIQETINCVDCVDCKKIKNCFKCEKTYRSVDCKNLINCIECVECQDCTNCINCNNLSYKQNYSNNQPKLQESNKIVSEQVLEDKNIQIYRAIKVDKYDNIDFNDIGKYWFLNCESVLNFSKLNKCNYILFAETDKDNIKQFNNNQILILDENKIVSPFAEKTKKVKLSY